MNDIKTYKEQSPLSYREIARELDINVAYVHRAVCKPETVSKENFLRVSGLIGVPDDIAAQTWVNAVTAREERRHAQRIAELRG